MEGTRLGMGVGNPQLGRGCGAFLEGFFLFLRNNTSLFQKDVIFVFREPKNRTNSSPFAYSAFHNYQPPLGFGGGMGKACPAYTGGGWDFYDKQ